MVDLCSFREVVQSVPVEEGGTFCSPTDEGLGLFSMEFCSSKPLPSLTARKQGLVELIASDKLKGNRFRKLLKIGITEN